MSRARRIRKDKQFKKALANGTARNQQNRKFMPVPSLTRLASVGDIITAFMKLFQWRPQ